MNALEKMLDFENKVIEFIKNNTYASDTVLQKHFCTEEIDKKELYNTIDNLIFDKKIERTYPKDSQVPVYIVIE